MNGHQLSDIDLRVCDVMRDEPLVATDEAQPETVTINIPEGYTVGTPDLSAWAQFCTLVEREEVSDV